MSFLTVVEQDASDVENALVNSGKALITYIDNITVTELVPALEAALVAAINTLGQDALAVLLGNATAAAPASTPPASS